MSSFWMGAFAALSVLFLLNTAASLSMVGQTTTVTLKSTAFYGLFALTFAIITFLMGSGL